MPDNAMDVAVGLLKGRFGYESFRAGQAELVGGMLHGRDCLGVMPTGAGKSICYQVPALAYAYSQATREAAGPDGAPDAAACADPANGEAAESAGSFSNPDPDVFEAYGDMSFRPAAALTLVVSPLVSLMSDQVMALKNAGIPAAFLNSRLTPRQQEEVLSRARAGAYALMYVAPERLDDPRFLAFVGAAAPADDVDTYDEWAAPYDGTEEAFWYEPERDDDPLWQQAHVADAGDRAVSGPAQSDLLEDPWAGGPADGPGFGTPQAAPAPIVSPPSIPIALVAVDEAHCVSQWGQDFRPSYLGIADFIGKLPARPVVAAFTATATPRVADDIVRLLGLREPLRVTTGFDRPNLRFEVEQLADKKKLARIAARALADPAESGIVYCSTRKDVEHVHEALVAAGVAATRYHAGLAHGEREANQRAFVNDDAPVMVATNAFGMGIDKSNVRYVIHHNMPGSLEAYYQEAGRAGRDGEPSECLLLWNDGDIATCRFFIEQETNNPALTPEEQQIVRSSQRRRLAAMSNYCMTTDCLRATILRYFGEGVAFSDAPGCGDGAAGPGCASAGGPESAAKRKSLAETSSAGQGDAAEGGSGTAGDVPVKGCGNCSNCTDELDAVDVTKTARAVMRCVHELRGRFGKGIVCDVLTGSKSARLEQYHLTNKKTYGIVDDSAATIKEIIELLTAGEYLEISEGRYPLVGLGPRAREAATDEFRLYMKRRRASSASRSARAHARPTFGGFTGVSGGASSSVFGGSGTSARRGSGDARAFGGGASSVFGGSGASERRGPGDASVFGGADGAASALSAEEQQALFERLRQLRKRLADEESVPPYIVFSDAALRAMCASLPADEDEFLDVPGVGPAKLKRYGQAFLAEINANP